MNFNYDDYHNYYDDEDDDEDDKFFGDEEDEDDDGPFGNEDDEELDEGGEALSYKEDDEEDEDDEVEDLEKQEKEEKKLWKSNAKMCNCPTIIQPPHACPDCKKHSLFIEPLAGLIIRDGILAIGACIGAEVPADWYSPFYCCVNKKCRSFYRNTGTKFYFNKQTNKLVKMKNYFHISR